MFLHFIRRLIRAFRYPNRTSYSIRWFFGKILYYDKNGVQIGYSVRRFWSGRKRYDMNDNLISYTRRNFWGGYDTYDANDNLISRSYRNFGGGYTTYDPQGKKMRESYPSFWGGMNYFDVDGSGLTESFTYKKHNSSRLKLQSLTENKLAQANTIKSSARKKITPHNYNQRITHAQRIPTKTEKKEETRECRTSTSNSTYKEQYSHGSQKRLSQSKETPANDVNKKIDYNSLFKQNIDKTIQFYETLSDCYEEQKNIDASVKILAFSYEKLSEFPACAYKIGDKVQVSPLIKNTSAFTFDISEISEADKKIVEGLDMVVIDNEFASLCGSKLITEFDDLFPEYEYKSDGIARVQYEMSCGLVITEKSWLKLVEAFCE